MGSLRSSAPDHDLGHLATECLAPIRNHSSRLVYLDTSAFVKLVVPEAETQALLAHLQRWSVAVSAALLRTEALRAATRASPATMLAVRRALRDLAFIDLSRDLLDHAGTLAPAGLRSLDAVHLAAALSLGDDLDELVTYDDRMIAAAGASGIVVASPR
jgi:predicted nucleic acid-binding protein